MSDDEGGFLKRIGIPASLVALISTAATISAFVFTVDSRYAKAEDIDLANSKLEQKVDALTAEVSRLAGVTQVLTQVAGRIESDARKAASAPSAHLSQPYSTSTFPESDSDVASTNAPQFNVTASKPQSLDAMPEVEQKPLVEQLKEPPKIDNINVANASSSDLKRVLQQSSETLNTSSQNLRKISEF